MKKAMSTSRCAEDRGKLDPSEMKRYQWNFGRYLAQIGRMRDGPARSAHDLCPVGGRRQPLCRREVASELADVGEPPDFVPRTAVRHPVAVAYDPPACADGRRAHPLRS